MKDASEIASRLETYGSAATDTVEPNKIAAAKPRKKEV